MPRAGISQLAAFQVTITGRFWVTAEAQGGVISPLLANIYLGAFDEAWARSYAHLGALVRYADDCAPRRRRSREERYGEA
jgi:retron-type reverse transcriptase